MEHRKIFISLFFQCENMSQKDKPKILNQREKIITIASHLMSQKGYKGASLQEIADLVGIHKSTLFHYFKNKEELLLAVLRIAIEDVTRSLTLILEDKNLSPEEKLRQAIVSHLDSLAKHIDNVNVYHSEIRFLSAKNKRKYLETRKYYALCFEKIIDEIKASDSGYFRALDTKIVTYAILGMCNWMAKWFKERGPIKIDSIADIFFKIIMPEGLY